MFRILSLLLGYAVGLIQTAYIVGRASGIDIREHGSGNAGMTNALRVMGFKAGLLVFVCDVMKAVAAYTICSLLFSGAGSFIDFGGLNILPGLYGGAGCILGHCFPFYLKFKGGKGMASTLGLILSASPWLTLAVAVVGISIVAVSKYISVASLVIAVMLPVGIYILGFGAEAVLVGGAIGALVWYLHRENIKRLMKGTENKFSLSGKIKANS